MTATSASKLSASSNNKALRGKYHTFYYLCSSFTSRRIFFNINIIPAGTSSSPTNEEHGGFVDMPENDGLGKDDLSDTSFISQTQITETVHQSSMYFFQC